MNNATSYTQCISIPEADAAIGFVVFNFSATTFGSVIPNRNIANS